MTAVPSIQATVLDVPLIENLVASFIYSFYEPQESVKYGVPSTKPARYIKLSWNPPANSRLSSIASLSNGYVGEETIKSNEFSVVIQQDDRTDNKVTRAINNLVSLSTTSSIQTSQLEQARVANFASSYQVSADVIANFVNDPSKRSHRFYDKSGKEVNSSAAIPTTSIKAIINNRVLGLLGNKLAFDSTSIFNDEAKGLVDSYSASQTQARRTTSAGKVSLDDYRLTINTGTYNNQTNDPEGVVGYLITRHDGKQTTLLSGGIKEFIDYEIKYGGTYSYNIRTLVRLNTNTIVNGMEVARQTVVASRPSNFAVVQCTETTPPPPPSDFNITWDFRNKGYIVHWSFPVNKQRDIAKFQVFKRRSITQPFQLVKEYDFYSGESPWPGRETPSSTSVSKANSTSWFDNTEGPWIYCVASVDAHGFASNYSAQYEVYFNPQSNKLDKKLVSVAGAPRVYPNFWVNEDAFVDAIKVDGPITRIRIGFMPEHLKLIDKNGNDLKLLKTTTSDSPNNNTYVLQIIDLDKQTSSQVKIRLNDGTTNRITR